MRSSALLGQVTIPKYVKFEAPSGFRDELIYGEIVLSPEPKVLHFQLADNLYKLLSAAVSDRYRVAQRINLRFHTMRSMPSPDVFVITRDEYVSALQSNRYPDGKQAVLAVEVLSPSNRKKNIDAKLALYRQFGIETWVVNPKLRKIDVLAKQANSYMFGKSISLPAALGAPAALGKQQINTADVFKLPG